MYADAGQGFLSSFQVWGQAYLHSPCNVPDVNPLMNGGGPFVSFFFLQQNGRGFAKVAGQARSQLTGYLLCAARWQLELLGQVGGKTQSLPKLGP